ncbi:hypothetical protein R0K30_21925, partial [Bacillus sp. SIMBA_154]
RDLAKTSNELGITSAPRPLVSLSELGEFKPLNVADTLMRKDQRDVIYVMAELNGRTPAEVIADVNADLNARNEGFEKKAWLTRHFFNNGG